MHAHTHAYIHTRKHTRTHTHTTFTLIVTHLIGTSKTRTGATSKLHRERHDVHALAQQVTWSHADASCDDNNTPNYTDDNCAGTSDAGILSTLIIITTGGAARRRHTLSHLGHEHNQKIALITSSLLNPMLMNVTHRRRVCRWYTSPNLRSYWTANAPCCGVLWRAMTCCDVL